MSLGNYVKSKLLQLEAFCIIVENDSNAAEACRKTGKSSQTLNNALLSLEDELKYQLFDRKGNYLTKINYWFDRDLYDNASPRLKSLIKESYQELKDKENCSFAAMQLNIDMYNLIDKLTKKINIKNY